MYPTPFWIVDSGSHSLSVELGFWIAIFSGIPDSPGCIPDSKAWDSGFHKQNFLVSRIWIPQAEIPGISDLLTWCDTGQLLFQVPTLGEYGPSTAGEIARRKSAVVERARVKNLLGWLIYDVVVNLKSPLKFNSKRPQIPRGSKIYR